jgi:DNA primase catalytic core
MARIPDEIIERLKQEVSVERLAEARGVKLKRYGKELKGLCPFHDDHEPSLCIDPVKNVWDCKGACGVGGSAIDWVMKAEGVSFRHAAELLRAEHPALLASAPVVKVGTVRKLAPPVERDASDAEMLDRIVSYYHQTLNDTPDALKYLEQRGLTHSEMIGHFRLGFANRTLGLRLPPKNRKAGAEMRARLEKLGILRESSGHEHMNGSLVIPIFNRAGELVQMYGRKITASLTKGTPLHLYLPGPHRGVWNEEALEAASLNGSGDIILCEALIDALTFWCAGYRNVTASYGVHGFTDDHRAAFRKYGVKRVRIAYDRDEAGDKAALALADELTAAGIECFRVLFPKGMDANEYARTTQPAAKSLGVLLNSAQWMGKGKPPERMRVEPVAAPVTPIDEQSATKEEKQPVEPEPLAAEEIEEPVPSLAAEPAAHEAELPPGPEGAPPLRISAPQIPVEIGAEEIAITLGDRRYRVRGLAKNLSYDLIKINLLVSRGAAGDEAGFHVDTLDLYAARQRIAFAKQAAVELGLKEEVIRHDLGHVLRRLEEIQQEQIRKALEPKREEIAIAGEEHTAAMELLRDPRLMDRIVEDLARCGVVGEEANKKTAILAAVSRLFDAPLAVVVQSSSAAGKSSLMDSILAFVPPEHRIEYSAMTGQSLFYMGETDLKHKVLAIVEEQGASRAAYALKLLQSEGVLTIASTGKDPVSGRLVTQQYRVEGPVMIFLTTTAIEIDEELLNRCLVLTVNEDREQTRAIHRAQREAQTLEGLLKRVQRNAVTHLHQNAQRLLRPLAVVNPRAPGLSFPDSMTRTRRDHMKYLTLIRASALLHQYQRPIQKVTTHGGETIEYIEATDDDHALANRLVEEVLGRSLDELPAQTRRLLLLIDGAVSSECERLKMERADFRFTRRDVRAWSAWGDTVLKKHLGRLEDMEYLAAHRGGRGQSFVYELVFAPGEDPSKARLPGLIDIYDRKKSPIDDEKSHPAEKKSPTGRPQVAGVSRGGRTTPEPITAGLPGAFPAVSAKTHVNGAAENHGPVVAAAQS